MTEPVDLEEKLAALRCGDSSCIYGCGKGMHTNGGCRCFKIAPYTERRKAHLAAQLLYTTIGELQELRKEVTRLNDKMRSDAAYHNEALEAAMPPREMGE